MTLNNVQQYTKTRLDPPQMTVIFSDIRPRRLHQQRLANTKRNYCRRYTYTSQPYYYIVQNASSRSIGHDMLLSEIMFSLY